MNLKALMGKNGIEGILVTNILNIRWLSGFTGTTGIVLIIDDKKYFITDFRYVTQGEKEVVPRGFELIREDKSPLEKVAEILTNHNIRRLGIEGDTVTISQMEVFKNIFPKLEYVNLENSFLKLRMIKTEEEISIIKEAVIIAEESLKETVKIIKPGMKESEVCTELEYQMKKRGATKPSFEIIVASNERSALPHGVATDKIIENEGFLKIDFGCFYKGYVSDITRTFYIGKNPSKRHLEIYNIVKEANELAISHIKAGITNKELDKIARDYITKKGYGDRFGHGLGHGIGLQIHEFPGVSYKAEEIVLQENMVITIEPGIYLEGFGGVRIEDDVVVKKNGYELLTTLTKDFVSIL